MNILNYFWIFLRGLAMGAADLVPGVSGGTIAFITGIYPRLIEALGQIPKQIPLLLKGKFSDFFKAIDALFLLVLLSGIGTSILLLSQPITYLLHHYPVLLNAFFMGLILASTLFIIRQNKHWKLAQILALALGFLFAFSIVQLPVLADQTDHKLYIFLSAMLAICAMILPGISGSFVLLVLGAYTPVLEALQYRNLEIIGIFVAGAALGLLSFVHLVSYLFKRYPAVTLASLIGFLLGALPKVWPWKNILSFRTSSSGLMVPLVTENVSPLTYTLINQVEMQIGITQKPAYLFLAIGLTCLGFFLVFYIEKIAKKIGKN